MFILFTICAFISLVVSDIGCRLVTRWGIVDDAASESHKSHSGRVPTGGGAAIVAAILAPLLMGVAVIWWCGQSAPHVSWLPTTIATHWAGLWLRSVDLVTLLSLGFVLFVLGTLDDRYKIAWPWRLGVQVLVAVAAVVCGWRATIFIDVPILTGVVSVVWIVGLTNAFNMLDNMNGLAGGVAAIVALFLGAVLFLAQSPNAGSPQLFLIGLLAVVFGAVAGFLIHNNPFRARLFMGDGGAYFLGFLFGTITLGTSYSSYAAPQTLFAPLLILAVPLYDMLSVVTIRISERRSPFRGDQRHFSHRLVALGLKPSSAVLVVYLTTIVTAVGSLLLYQLNTFGAALVLAQTVMMLLLIAVLEKW
ncbi:MAG: MraY family glycosyltransferase [Thermoguttaceae bacterium]